MTRVLIFIQASLFDVHEQHWTCRDKVCGTRFGPATGLVGLEHAYFERAQTPIDESLVELILTVHGRYCQLSVFVSIIVVCKHETFSPHCISLFPKSIWSQSIRYLVIYSACPRYPGPGISPANLQYP